MNELTLENGQVKLVTPHVNSMDEIKKDIVQTADCIKARLTYPNGLILDIEQHADKISIKTNQKITNTNGTITFEP